EPPAPVITEFKVFDPFPQPITFSETNRRIYFPIEAPDSERMLTIKIFNFIGENVKTLEGLVSGSLREPGEAPSWDGTNFTDESVAPGIYYYSIRLLGHGMHTGKIMVMQ
ncbi:MAG: hypothetical protein HOC71_10385, partial [Candidatus Latescibacteria bacterium]|nr:hypothetical protein [Candidatus Latescibacterota bacterium]